MRGKPTRDAAAEAREKLQHTLEDDEEEEDDEEDEGEELEYDSPGTKSADAATPDEHDAKEASVQVMGDTKQRSNHPENIFFGSKVVTAVFGM